MNYLDEVSQSVTPQSVIGTCEILRCEPPRSPQLIGSCTQPRGRNSLHVKVILPKDPQPQNVQRNCFIKGNPLKSGRLLFCIVMQLQLNLFKFFVGVALGVRINRPTL